MSGNTDEQRSRGWLLNRRQLLNVGLGVAGAAVLAACSGTTTRSSGKHSSLKLPNFTPARSLPGVTISKVTGVGPAYSSYPSPAYQSVAHPPITSGKPVTTFQILYPAPPPALAKNVWWQQFNKRLGAEVRPTLAAAANYADKLTTTVASGNIPDITWIEPGQGAPGIVRTIKEGAFTDLTDILAGDGIKKYPNLAQIPTYAWKNCAIENTIYGIPRPVTLLIADAPTLYRQDWATKLGYPEPPKSGDELTELLTAFTKGDPTGKYKGQTWGQAGLYPRFFHMMYRVPNFWRENSGGTLTYWVESDEVEQSLTYLRKLWKAGIFHPDAVTNAWTATGDNLFLSDKVGATTGSMNNQFGATGNLSGNFRAAHPKAELGHMLPVGFDGGKPAIWQQAGYFGISAIPASVGKDEKRLEELLRVLDYWGAAFGSEEFLFMNYGIEGRHYHLDSNGNPVAVVGKVQDERDLNYLNQPVESVNYYPGVEGDSLAGQKYLEQAAQAWIPNPVQGLISDTDIRQGAAIRQLEDDYQNGIITGRRPMSDLKAWRDAWKKAGGDNIRKEYQESLQRAKSS
jgi:putative aldouronate transport system substrate-binding protein